MDDLTGRIIGRLTVTGFAEQRPGRSFYWKVRCECGTEKAIERGNLLSGRTNSCGCFRNERSSKIRAENIEAFTGARLTHGMTGTPTFSSWNSMMQRCTNPKRHNYEYYGGRGIKVCERWYTFSNFLADMGVRPDGLTLDRIDNSGNYEPANCRWVTMAEQNKNRRPRGKDRHPRKRMAPKTAPDAAMDGSGKRKAPSIRMRAQKMGER